MITFSYSYALALLCSLLGAGYVIAGKMLSANINPMGLTLLRMSIAIICFIPFIKFKSFKKITKTDWILLLLAGFFGIFLTNVLYFKSLETTTALEASLINSLVPLFTLLASNFCSRKVPSGKQLLAFLISLIGVLIISTEGNFNPNSTFYNYGNGIMLASVCTWVIYNMAAQYKSNNVSPQLFTFAAFLIGLVPLIFFGANSNFHTLIFNMNKTEWILIFYISAIATGLAYYLNVKAIEGLGSDTASFVNYGAAPILVCILSYILFDETFTLWKIIGTICILLSLVVHESSNIK